LQRQDGALVGWQRLSVREQSVGPLTHSASIPRDPTACPSL
jgi:hypothetical protein